MSKPFWTSKTLWVNFAVAVVGLIAIFSPKVRDALPDGQIEALALGLIGVANIVLRLVTDKPVSIE